MKKLIFFLAFTLSVLNYYDSAGQNKINTPIANSNNTYTLSATLDSLEPMTGAPRAPFYTYLWWFGDGHFSFKPSPTHGYANDADRTVQLAATGNYGTNGPPPMTRKIKDTKLFIEFFTPANLTR